MLSDPDFGHLQQIQHIGKRSHQESKITDINNKIQTSNVLNNFFYGNTSSKTYNNKTKYIIYIVTLLVIIINLIVLSIKYGNKEVNNE